MGAMATALALALLLPDFLSLAELRVLPSRDEPFGVTKIVSPEGHITAEWRKLMRNVQVELSEVKRCRAIPGECTRRARQFEAIVNDAKGKQGLAKIALVNERVNGQIRYASDSAGDTWALALATVAKSAGDCEDYAIAKYAALHQAGVPDADLRLVLVHDTAVRIDHAVLAVRHDGQWLILDNRWNALRPDKEFKQFKPLYIVERHGVSVLSKVFRLDGRPVVPSAR
jgi:predicted transglutaminase-like cysteine proteinase